MLNFVHRLLVTLYFLYCLISITLKCFMVNGSYIVFPREKVPWLNASRICKSTYNGKLLSTVDGSMEKSTCLNNYAKDTELWSSRGSLFSPFLSHEGCFSNLSNHGSGQFTLDKVQSVGECWRLCHNGTTYIAIQKEICYCFTGNNKPIAQQIHHNNCKTICKNSTFGNFEYCGGDTAFNLYKRLQKNRIQGNNVEERCVALYCIDPTSSFLKSESCNKGFKYVCGNKTYINDREDINFTTASSRCKTNHNSYLSPDLALLCDTQQSLTQVKYWLDIRRYMFLYSEMQDITKGREFKCSYFPSGIREQYIYVDACINSNEERNFACETDSIHNHTNSPYCSIDNNSKTVVQEIASTKLHGHVFSSEFHKNTEASIDRNSSSTTSDATNRYMDFEEPMNREKPSVDSSTIGIAVGVLLTSVIVAAVITLFILRRRKLQQKELDNFKSSQESDEGKKISKQGSNQSTLPNHNLSQEGTHYFQLEAKPKQNRDIESSPVKQVPSDGIDTNIDDTVYVETGNDVYDHLNKRRDKQNEREDMYHVANVCQGDIDEYQHIHTVQNVTRHDSSSDYAKFNEEEYSSVNRT